MKTDGFTVQSLVNRFLSTERHLVDTSEITQGTFTDLFDTCQRVGDNFGCRDTLPEVSVPSLLETSVFTAFRRFV